MKGCILLTHTDTHAHTLPYATCVVRHLCMPFQSIRPSVCLWGCPSICLFTPSLFFRWLIPLRLTVLLGSDYSRLITRWEVSVQLILNWISQLRLIITQHTHTHTQFLFSVAAKCIYGKQWLLHILFFWNVKLEALPCSCVSEHRCELHDDLGHTPEVN